MNEEMMDSVNEIKCIKVTPVNIKFADDKYTTVEACIVDESECNIEPQIEETTVNVASERLDVVIAAVYGFSRNISNRMIMAERVSINGKITTNNSVNLKIGDKISVRKYGKFIYEGISNQSKKGRYFVKIGKFV